MADDSFKEFVLDQLRALPDLRAKAMFGGYGLYQGERFFAILAGGRLFFKTDSTSRENFIARGMSPFTYEQRGRRMTMQYHEVPAEILENPQELVRWAQRAVSVASGGGLLRKGPQRKRTTRKPAQE